MKFYTSYYANFWNIPKNYLCIGIDKKIPKPFQTTTIKNFLYTPNTILGPADILNNLPKEEYIQKYYNMLHNDILFLGFQNALDYFTKMNIEFSKSFSEFEAIVFLGYAKPNEFSHRDLIRALLNNIGIDCEELKVYNKIISKEDFSLF
jgi:hypothetical protein